MTISGGSTPRPRLGWITKRCSTQPTANSAGTTSAAASERWDPGRHQHGHQEVGAQDDQITMGQLDHAHGAERDREPEPDDAVEAAEQEPVEQSLEQLHGQPK